MNFDLKEFDHEKHLRVSLTKRCQLKCYYCTNEGQGKNCGIELSAEEWIKLICYAVKNEGYSHLRLTGGEPTLRHDLVDIIKSVRKETGVEVGINTNAIFIKPLAEGLSSKEMDYVSASLDTLSDAKFKSITRTNFSIDQVINNLISLRKHGYIVKVNTVLLKGMGKKEVQELFSFSAENDFIYSLCDYFGPDKRLYVDPIKFLKDNFSAKVIDESYSLTKMEVDGVPFIAAKVRCDYPKMSKKYCMECYRKDEMKITAEGELKPCFPTNSLNVPVKDILDEPNKLHNAFEQARQNRICLFKKS